ncbi:MAG: hypothetical protein ACFFDN_10710 [Candidatus Hodarchaeota archaeon]
MLEDINRETCMICNQPLYPQNDITGNSHLVCLNKKCPTKRFDLLEERLSRIERHLTLRSPSSETIADQTVTPKIEPAKTQMEDFKNEIMTLPLKSPEIGLIHYQSLKDRLGLKNLEDLIEKIAVAYSPEKNPINLEYWAILKTYARFPYFAAQTVLIKGAKDKYKLIDKIIIITNLISSGKEDSIDSKQFYTKLLNIVRRKCIPKNTYSGLEQHAGISGPRNLLSKGVDLERKEGTINTTNLEIFNQSYQKVESENSVSFFERYQPKRGWEFEIGANWLRWIGVAAILLAIFLLITWSSQFVKISQESINLIAFFGMISLGVYLHITSYVLLRRYTYKNQFIKPITESIAFIALGIYFLGFFALRFHPSSPFNRFEQLFILLLIFLLLITVITAWRYNSSTIFIEGFGIGLWGIWHVSSQILINNPTYNNFPLDLLWLSMAGLTLGFLVIAYRRKDIALTIFIEIFAQVLLLLPNSSSIFRENYALQSFLSMNQTTIILLVFCSLYWMISYHFPLDAESKFFGYLNRDHLYLISLSPVFLSCILLIFGSISVLAFTLIQIIFTSLFLLLAYRRKNIDLAVFIEILAQVLLLLASSSAKMSESYTLRFFSVLSLSINYTTLFLFAFCILFWMILYVYPLDIESKYLGYMNRDHLSLFSITPVFLSYVFLISGKISVVAFTSIQIVFLSLFLWLAFKRADVGIVFIAILLIELFWFLPNFPNILSTHYFSLPPIFPHTGFNFVVILLLFQTYLLWHIILGFPIDLSGWFWDKIQAKYLHFMAVPLIIIGYLLAWNNYIGNFLIILYLVVFPILGSMTKDVVVNVDEFSLRDISPSDILTYVSAGLFILTLPHSGSNTVVSLIGIVIFPILIYLNQLNSRMNLEDREIRGFYPIINCVYISTLFLFIIWKNQITEIKEWINYFFSFLPNIVEHELDSLIIFVILLWVSIFTILNIRTHYKSIQGIFQRFLISIAMPILFLMVFILKIVAGIFSLMFIILGYVYYLICWYLLSSYDNRSLIKDLENAVSIPSFAILQYLGFNLFNSNIIQWNIFLAVLMNFLLPAIITLLMMTRRQCNHLFDSYFIGSLMILTVLQITFLKTSLNNSIIDFWVLEFVFFVISAIYLLSRIHLLKDQFDMPYKGASFLYFITEGELSNKDNLRANLTFFFIIGFISNFICVTNSPNVWISTVLFIVLDFMLLISIVFILKLTELELPIIFSNILSLYSIWLLLRLTFINSESQLYNSQLIIGILLQILIHISLIQFSKSNSLSSTIKNQWYFENKGKSTLPDVSFRFVAILNLIIYYIFVFLVANVITGEFLIAKDMIALLIIVISLFLAMYYVILSKIANTKLICDAGLMISVIVTLYHTYLFLEVIYFTAAITSFLVILYGFWVDKKEWRIFGFIIIGFTMLYSTIFLIQLPNDLLRILGLGILGIISITLGFIYVKFSSKFVKKQAKASIGINNLSDNVF